MPPQRPCAATLHCVLKRASYITVLSCLSVGLHFQKCFCNKNPVSDVIAYVSSPFYSLAYKWEVACTLISQNLKHIQRRKGFLEKLIFSIIRVQRASFFSAGHNSRESFPFIQIVKLAFSPTVITRISVTAFADLNKSRQGHLIGVECVWLSFTKRLISGWQVAWVTAMVPPYWWCKSAMSHTTSGLIFF